MNSFILACFIALGIGFLFVLALRGLPLSRKGIQSAIQMDNATFLRTNEENIIIKRRTFYIWFVLIFLGIFELVLLAMDILIVADLIKGKDVSLVNMSEAILTTLGLGYILFLNIQSLRRPSMIRIDANSRAIVIGHGLMEKQIPFSQISQVLGGILNSSPELLGKVNKMDIRIVLTNGEVIVIGSVSGKNPNTRAVAIARQITEVTGMNIQNSPK